MIKFAVIVALCAVLCYESTASEEQGLQTINNELNQALEEHELQSISNEFKKAMQKLINAVDHARLQAKEKLKKALQKVKSVAIELEKKAAHEVEKGLVHLRKKLDDIVARAKTEECKKYIDDFEKTPEKLLLSVKECIAEQVNKAESYVKDAVKYAKKIKDDLTYRCHGDRKEKAKCLRKLVPKILRDSERVPLHILKDAAKMTGLVRHIIPNIEGCLKNHLKKAVDEATHDISKLAKCVGL